jgi:RHS repeat-associated protein
MQERDAETTGWQDALDWTPNRLYSEGFGRWMSPDPRSGDPLNPQTWNRYSYAFNNPINLVDHTGKWPTETHDEIYALALPGLSDSQMKSIEMGSAAVDLFMQGDANMHAMCSPGQSESQCWQGISNDYSAAISLSQSADSEGDAFMELGVAEHIATDFASPWHVDANGTPLCWGCSTKDDTAHVKWENADAADIFDAILNGYGSRIAEGISNARATAAMTLTPARYKAATAGSLGAINSAAWSGILAATGAFPTTIMLNEVTGCLVGNPAACPDGFEMEFQLIMGGGGGSLYPSATCAPISGRSRPCI